jgi:hypothetical protein
LAPFTASWLVIGVAAHFAFALGLLTFLKALRAIYNDFQFLQNNLTKHFFSISPEMYWTIFCLNY